MEAEFSSNKPIKEAALAPGEPDGMPSAKDTAVIAIDSLLTVLQLFKAEAALAIKSLPTLLALHVYRVPTHLLTWASFCVLLAAGVQKLTGNLLLTLTTFFLLQLGATVIVEWRTRQLHKKVSFSESRKGVAMIYAGLMERLHDDKAA